MSNCHSCKFSASIPGDCHISCNAPVLSKESRIKISLAIISGHQSLLKEPLGLSFDAHGISSGWCNFPFNYDPVWISGECKIQAESIILEEKIAELKKKEIEEQNLIAKS